MKRHECVDFLGQYRQTALHSDASLPLVFLMFSHIPTGLLPIDGLWNCNNVQSNLRCRHAWSVHSQSYKGKNTEILAGIETDK